MVVDPLTGQHYAVPPDAPDVLVPRDAPLEGGGTVPPMASLADRPTVADAEAVLRGPHVPSRFARAVLWPAQYLGVENAPPLNRIQRQILATAMEGTGAPRRGTGLPEGPLRDVVLRIGTAL